MIYLALINPISFNLIHFKLVQIYTNNNNNNTSRNHFSQSNQFLIGKLALGLNLFLVEYPVSHYGRKTLQMPFHANMFWQYNEQELYTPVCGVLAICLQQESTQLLLLNWINAIAQHISYTVKVTSREDLPQPSSDHWEKTTTERKQQLRENNHWEKTTTERKQQLRENKS